MVLLQHSHHSYIFTLPKLSTQDMKRKASPMAGSQSKLQRWQLDPALLDADDLFVDLGGLSREKYLAALNALFSEAVPERSKFGEMYYKWGELRRSVSSDVFFWKQRVNATNAPSNRDMQRMAERLGDLLDSIKESEFLDVYPAACKLLLDYVVMICIDYNRKKNIKIDEVIFDGYKARFESFITYLQKKEHKAAKLSKTSSVPENS